MYPEKVRVFSGKCFLAHLWWLKPFCAQKMSSQRSQSASKERKISKNDIKEARDCEKELEKRAKKCAQGSKYEPKPMLENRAQTIEKITKK